MLPAASEPCSGDMSPKVSKNVSMVGRNMSVTATRSMTGTNTLKSLDDARMVSREHLSHVIQACPYSPQQKNYLEHVLTPVLRHCLREMMTSEPLPEDPGEFMVQWLQKILARRRRATLLKQPSSADVPVMPDCFQVAIGYPKGPRAFLLSCAHERSKRLLAKTDALDTYFRRDADGQQRIQKIMNSPDLTSQPSLEVPECSEFKDQVKDLFRAVVREQELLEEEDSFGVRALSPYLNERRVMHDVWVIGAKLQPPSSGPILSMGDTLVMRLTSREYVSHVWTTSRSKQDDTAKYAHFSCDLNRATSDDFQRQMESINERRRGVSRPLVIYFIFANTGTNCERDLATNISLNGANIDTTRAFIDAAREVGWLSDPNIRIISVSSFHCSPERATYEDKLPVAPEPSNYGGVDADAFKAALAAAKARAGLIEYTSAKFASTLLLAGALVEDPDVSAEIEEQVDFIEKLHLKLQTFDEPQNYDRFNAWVLSTCTHEIERLSHLVDGFFEDSMGEMAVVRRPDLRRRYEVVKIPFALTTMIALRAARTSVKCKVMSLNDAWVRTRGRLGWAISPETGAVWMECAAKRMEEAARSTP